MPKRGSSRKWGGEVESKLEENKKTRKMEVASVLFVPRSERGTLTERLRKEEEVISCQSGYRVKIVERGGTKLGDMLIRSDPFAGADCRRKDCYQCLTKSITCKWIPCWRRNSTYMATCFRCKEKGVVAVYHGETSKSLYTRALQHVEKLKSWDTANFMLKHNIEQYPEDDNCAKTTCGSQQGSMPGQLKEKSRKQ